MRMIVRTAFTALLFLLSITALADVLGKVVSVIDGDTIKVLDDENREHKIHLSGIDAPERGQPYGTKSRDYLASLVAGKEVKVESNK